MKRRHFISALGAIAATPICSPLAAQPGARPRRVAVFLGSATEDDAESQANARTLQGVLHGLGWSEGRQLQFHYRYSAGNPALMDVHIAELVKLEPDVIVVRGNRPAALMKAASSSIPIVFAQVGDPVGSGLIRSLARPGGNVTGFTHFEPAMAGKWLEILKEIDPSVSRVAVLMHPNTPANVAFLQVAEASAPKLGMAVMPAGVRDAGEIERAVAAANAARTGMAVMPHDVTIAHHGLIVALMTRYRLPAVYPYRLYPAAGGLISYSFDTQDHWRQVGRYVDRILRGEKPAELPVQAPTKFELVINLKTAAALGLAVPPTLLARADEVIE
jgi:putative ABC transport system substrate-binding protein